MNSLYALIGFLIFLAAGYLCLIKTLFQQHARIQPGSTRPLGWWPRAESFRSLALLRVLGSGGLVVQLPSISLLLYFGWGPALIWLLCYFLFIETLIFFVWGNWQESEQLTEISEPRLETRSKLWQPLMNLLRVALIAIFAVVTAKTIYQDSSLLFLVIGTLLSLRYFNNAGTRESLWTRLVVTLSLIALTAMLSNHLGVSIYGEWQLSATWAPWIRINNESLITIAIIVLAFQHLWSTGSTVRNHNFRQHLMTGAGILVLILLFTTTATILVSQPELDAPLQNTSTQTEHMPLFLGLSLFLGFGFFASVTHMMSIRNQAVTGSILLIGPTSTNQAPQVSGESLRDILHASALINLICAVALTLLLAAAVGIGAWETHYSLWADDSTILDHYSLAVYAISETLGVSKLEPILWLQKGVNLLFALLTFSALLYWSWGSHNIALSENQRDTSRLNQRLAGTVMVISCSLLALWVIEYGFERKLWLVLGAAAWYLVLDVILEHLQRHNYPETIAKVLAIACLGMVSLGFIQLFYLIITSSILGYYLDASLYALIALGAMWTWRGGIVSLALLVLKKPPQDKLFDAN